MDKWIELQRFYEEWKEETKDDTPNIFGLIHQIENIIYLCIKQMNILKMVN